MSISSRTLCSFHKSKILLITCDQLHIQYSNRRDAQAFTAVAAYLADTLVVLRSNGRSLANGSGWRKWERSAKNSGDGKGRWGRRRTQRGTSRRIERGRKRGRFSVNRNDMINRKHTTEARWWKTLERRTQSPNHPTITIKKSIPGSRWSLGRGRITNVS